MDNSEVREKQQAPRMKLKPVALTSLVVDEGAAWHLTGFHQTGCLKIFSWGLVRSKGRTSSQPKGFNML